MNGQRVLDHRRRPSRFHGFILERSADVWIVVSRERPDLMMIARLKPGVTAVQAQAALHAYFRQYLLERFRGEFPADQRWRPSSCRRARGSRNCASQYRGALLALMALVTLVLFTTCTNVGNLLMVRNTARQA